MKKTRLLITILICAAFCAAAICVCSFTAVPVRSSFADAISVYTRNKPGAEITCAVVSMDGASIAAYGHDGKEIPVPERRYELAQTSGIFTGAAAAKAVSDGYLELNAEISDYLTLIDGAYSPTVKQLLTGTSAYSDYSLLPDNLISRLTGKSSRYPGIGFDSVISGINNFRLSYNPPFLYSPSDFGIVSLSAVISKVYDVDYYSILTLFIQNSLGLSDTYIDLEGSTRGFRRWSPDDAYISALGLSSTIDDMVKFSRMFFDGENTYLNTMIEPLAEVNADESAGYVWKISNSDWILKCSGSSGHYSSAVRIDLNRRAAAIVLSNYADDRYGSADNLAELLLSELLLLEHA